MNYIDKKVDIAVIGAGSAGLTAFKKIIEKNKNANAILIDHGPLGTTCSRIGCMPSKTLIQVAEYFNERDYFQKMGIHGSNHLSVNMKEVMSYVRKLRDHFVSYTLKTIEDVKGEKEKIHNEYQFIEGTARFIDKNVLEVITENNNKTRNFKVIAKNIIIATGSYTYIPREWESFKQDFLTIDDFFEQEDFKKDIIVIGGGSIGLELGQALSRLSISTKLIHSHETLGTITDPVVNEYVLNTLRKDMDIYINEKATLIKKDDNGITVKISKEEFKPNQVLVSIGRRPNLQDLNLKEIGVPFDAKGIPVHDPATLKIQGFPIYLAGDVLNDRPVLHEAIDSGMMAGYNVEQKEPFCFNRRTPLNIIFTHPNIAIIGSTFSELMDNKESFVTGEALFDNQGRATIMSQNKGIIHLYGSSNDGRLLGAELFVPEGEHIAHLLALAIQQQLTVFDLLKMPFYHPVLEEGLRTALHDLANKLKVRKTTTELLMCSDSGVEKLR